MYIYILRGPERGMANVIQRPTAQLCRDLANELSFGLTGYPGDGEVCRIVIEDGANSARLNLRLLPGSVEVVDSSQHDVGATVWVSAKVANILLDEAYSVDLRDPRIYGGIRYQGNPRLVTLMGQALLRPSAKVRAVYEAAEVRARRAPPVVTVQRAHQPSATLIREAFAASRPMVVTGLLERGMPRTWDELTRRIGHVMIEPPSFGRTVRLSEFLGHVLTRAGSASTYSEGCLLPALTISELQPRFADDPSAPNGLDLGRPQLWAGVSDGSQLVTGLHRDPTDGLLAQMIGRKWMLLYSPLECDKLYPATSYNSYQNCWVDPLKPRLEVHARFKDAQKLDVELTAGDVLVLPSGWFHCASIVGPSFSVSFPLKGG
jgi:cupin-like protein